MARVHLMPPQHNAGAEHMLVSMLRPLVERGHDVQVWLSRYGKAHEVYDYRGIRVVPLEARLDFPTAVRQADVLISHLECVPSTSALARGYGKPVVVLCHNTHRPTFRDMAAGNTALAVYNSRWMQAEAELFFAEYPKAVRPGAGIIVRPPVFADEYATKPGKAVTLVNCNVEKGGRVLEALARRMPEQQFLAVKGAYGEQILPDLPNVEVLDHVDGADMRERVYARTRVLLMPSSYESWGRAGVEALASGLPVIAHPTPGLCESLGRGGIFVDRTDIDGYEAVLTKLLSSPSEYRLASKRARERSRELNPTAELRTWVEEVESLAKS
ncbi:glycosyltransferase family 4 protein [Streptomyces pseudogriseolus]|uniref:glycosyltransferase family 4 protein n=1 Tax=Streptomyces pseudogriseolus TaxID=36817 RepID=UPI003FA20D1C